MIFDDRTRTRTRTCKRVQSFISLSKKECTFTALPNIFFYLTENVLTTYYYTYTNPFIKGDSMNLTLMLYLFLTFLPVTLVKIELQKRALHQMNS